MNILNMARADSQNGKMNVRGIWGESKLQKAIMGLLYLNILACLTCGRRSRKFSTTGPILLFQPLSRYWLQIWNPWSCLAILFSSTLQAGFVKLFSVSFIFDLNYIKTWINSFIRYGSSLIGICLFLPNHLGRNRYEINKLGFGTGQHKTLPKTLASLAKWSISTTVLNVSTTTSNLPRATELSLRNGI